MTGTIRVAVGQSKGKIMDSKGRYSMAQIVLHWTIAVLIVANYFISDGMPEFFDKMMGGQAVTGFVPNFHVWAGVTILVLVLLRLVVRIITGAPEGKASATLADRAAGWGHALLYLLMIAVPTFGAIAWFGQTETTANLHVLSMNVMMLVILGHAAMAVFHHYFLKDGLLSKMNPVR